MSGSRARIYACITAGLALLIPAAMPASVWPMKFRGPQRRRKIQGSPLFLSFPPMTRHNVFTTGTGPLKCVFIVSKAFDEEPQRKSSE